MFVASTIDLLVIMGYLFNSPIDMSIYTWLWMHMYDILYYITTEKPEQIIIPAFRSFNITNGTAELTYVMIVPKDMNKLEEINNQYSGRLVIGTLFADMPGLGMNIGEMQLSVSFENIFSVKRANGCEFDTSLTFNVTNPFDFKGECEIELYEPVDDLGMYFISISPMYPYYYADILLDYYMFMPVSMGYPQEVHG